VRPVSVAAPASATPSPKPQRRVGPLAIGQQPLVASYEPGPRRLVHLPGARLAGTVSHQLGVAQQLGHAGRPALPGLVGDRVQLAQQVRAAQRMHRVVAPVGRPAVVDGHPTEAGQHLGGVHRLVATLGMHGEQAQPGGGGRVDPVQPARHPGAGLVKVRHRRGRQSRTHDLDEPGQPGRTLGQHRGQRPVATGAPSTSASSCAARSMGRCWWMHK